MFNPYHIYSRHGGFFISNVGAGDLVSKGDALGAARSFFGEIVGEIQVPTDGVIHMVTSPSVYDGRCPLRGW